MAILLAESFDWLSSAEVDAGSFGLYSDHSPIGNPNMTIVSGRTSNCLDISPDTPTNREDLQYIQGIQMPISGAAGRDYVVGFAVKFDNTFSTQTHQAFLGVLNTSSNWNLQLSRVNPTNVLRIGRGTTSNAYTETFATGTKVIANAVWYYIEVKFNLHSSTGEFTVRVNGIQDMTFSGDTENSLGDVVQAVIIGMNNDNTDHGDIQFDDVYILDGTGSNNTDFLGDVQVENLNPNGNGTTNQWTGSDADSTDNYLHVDESTSDGDTSYTEDTTTGNKDLYAYEAVGTDTASVYGAMVKTVAKKVDAGANDIVIVARSGATESDSSAVGLSAGSYTASSVMYETDPNTGSLWTESAINGAEFGVKVN